MRDSDRAHDVLKGDPQAGAERRLEHAGEPIDPVEVEETSWAELDDENARLLVQAYEARGLAGRLPPRDVTDGGPRR